MKHITLFYKYQKIIESFAIILILRGLISNVVYPLFSVKFLF